MRLVSGLLFLNWDRRTLVYSWLLRLLLYRVVSVTCRLFGGSMLNRLCRCFDELLLLVIAMMVARCGAMWCRVLRDVVSLRLLLRVIMVGVRLCWCGSILVLGCGG